ncbi:hypothetical protein EMPS_05683 [Entomortierella parvispora]|uniref:Uncharacterized protein n=1 Tax=Entomortierella parvispora TaxID=205924 RepID=A0A9P3HB74_9FUNG|nr:hypothetical protein EMPS_05683 [Entomortierella parvispora]
MDSLLSSTSIQATPSKVAFLFLPGLGTQDMQQDMVDNAEMILTSQLSKKEPTDQQQQRPPDTGPTVAFRGIAYAKLVHDDQMLSVKGMGMIERLFTFLPRRLLVTSLRYAGDPDIRERVWSWICRDIRDMALELEKDNHGNHSGAPPSLELIPIAFSMGSVILLEFLSAARAWFVDHGEAFQQSQQAYRENGGENPRQTMVSLPWFQSSPSTCEPGERRITQARLSVLGMEGLRLLSCIRLVMTLACPLNLFHPPLICEALLPSSIRWFNLLYSTDALAGPLVGQGSVENVLISPAWSLANVLNDPWEETMKRLLAKSLFSHSVTLLDGAVWAQVLEKVSIQLSPSKSPWTTGILTPIEDGKTAAGERGTAVIVKRDSGVDLGECARASEQHQEHDLSISNPWGSSTVPARLILPTSFDPSRPMVAVIHLQGLGDSERYEQEAKLFQRGLNYSADLVRQCSSPTQRLTGGVSVIGVSIGYGAILEQGQRSVLDGIRTGLEQGHAALQGEPFSESAFIEYLRHFIFQTVPITIGPICYSQVEKKVFAAIDASIDSLATVVQALRRGHGSMDQSAPSNTVPVVPVIMLGLSSGGIVASHYLSQLQRQQGRMAGKEEALMVEKGDCRFYFRTLYTLGNFSVWVMNLRSAKLPSLPWKSLFSSVADDPSQVPSTTGWFNFHYQCDVFGRGDLCSISTEEGSNCFAKVIRKDLDVQDSSSFEKIMSLGNDQDKHRKGGWFWGLHSLWDLVGARWFRKLMGGYTGEYLREEGVWCSVAKAIIEAGEELQLGGTSP